MCADALAAALLLLCGLMGHIAGSLEVAGDGAPYFKRIPRAYQSHLEGNRLVLTCLAEGSFPLEFRWIRNGSEVAPASNEHRYIISSLRPSDHGLYQCIVRNHFGALLQPPTEVQVVYLGEFEDHAERRVKIPAGGTLILEPPWIPSFPLPQVTWFREGRKVLPSSRVALTLDRQLVISSLHVAEGGTYRAHVLNERNGEIKAGPPVIVTVGEAEAETETVYLRVVVPPKNTTTVAGSRDVVFECVPDGRPMDLVTVTWRRGGVPVVDGMWDFGRRLSVAQPGRGDEGWVECQVGLEGKRIPPITRSAYLTVLESPQFKLHLEQTTTSTVEHTLYIPCRVTGYPKPQLAWYRDAVPVRQLQESRMRVLTNGSLVISFLEERDSAMYQCFARNSAGEANTYTYLRVISFAPNITRRPDDLLSVEGDAVTLPCDVSGAPQPTVTWFKGDTILHLGSTANKQGQASSRLFVLPPGSLLISPVLLTDAGNYICVARNYRGEASARARLVVWARTRITEAPRDRGVVRGRSVELRCEVVHDPAVSASVSWIKDGAELGAAERARLLRGGPGGLHISHATPTDSGAYTCLVTSSAGNDSRTARIEVRELPGPPQAPGVRVSAAGRRMAEMGWARGYDGNSALVRYVLETSVDDSAWRVLVPNLAPESTTALSPALKPGHSYRFRLIAVNAVGPGEPSIETDSLVLPEEPPERFPQHLRISERSNHSLSLCWQPPEVDYWNGPLKGYLIRFRASEDVGDFQYKNIPSPAMTAMTIPELHPWQTYEVAIAAYNSAGLGPYSTPLVQRTLEGVPLTAPARVQLRSLNSTSVRVAWSQPDSQKLRGTLLGYKVEVWRPGLSSESLNVDVPPEPPGGGRVAQVTGLLAYTDYTVTVCCTTSAGNGPRSAPRRVRTHEDTPGPVQSLQLLDFSKTSLLLSWGEPKELNGVLFGYQLSWQQGNRTHVIVTHNLDNSFHKYRITGLEEHATYLLHMAARTSAGSGPVRSLTFTAGHMPAVPGAPVVLSVSRVAARSLLLQVRSGPERGTSITHWIVEAQTGLTDKGGNWTVLREIDAEPQKRSLLVNELQPYTFYRLRVRQGTAVAVSQPSPATRWVQTLPAPPDIAPSNITVRTAGSQSIWVRWAPLAVEDYQAIPESVGYRVRCKHKEFPTSLPLDATTDDRGEREASLEGLRPYSTYVIQVQAFNANGPGPWTEVVEATTSEAAPSAGPMDVYANATSPSAILVGWGMVPKQDHNGQILGFKVSYQAVGTNLPPSIRRVQGAAAGCVLLTGLRVFTEYTVKVQAFTHAGDGAATSSTALIRTHDDVPGPPTMIFFPEVQPTSVLMTWQPPENPNGVVLGYRVSFWLDVSSHRAFSVVQLGADARRFTTSDLIPESIYRFRMVARTHVGWGDPAEVVVVTTESRARPDPPGKPSVPRAGVAARSVTLTWTPGSDHSAPLRYYTVQARILPGDPRWEAVAPSLPPGLTSYTLDRLKPFTSYRFRISSTNDVGMSPWSEPSTIATTLQAAPEEPPRVISAIPHTPSSVLLQWEPPSTESLNGVLLGYRVLYREVEEDPPSGVAPLPLAPPGLTQPSPIQAKLLDQFDVKVLNSSSLTFYELAHLEKFRRYEIVLSAFNAAGNGPSTTPIQVFVGEAVPSAPPSNVKVEGTSSSQLQVTWSPPPASSHNGVLQGYKVFYKAVPRHDGNVSERIRILYLPETSVRLKGLEGFTRYSVRIIAYNTAGQGPSSSIATGRTLPAAPSAPSFLHFADVLTSSLNVSWGEPAQPNGLLEGYHVLYHPIAHVPEMNKAVIVDVKKSSPRWIRFTGLTPRVSYSFRVKGMTFTYGPEVSGNVTMAPAEGAPGPPGRPVVVQNGADLQLQWSKGSAGHSRITGYVIEARPVEGGEWDLLVNGIERQATGHTIRSNLLHAGVAYILRVSAMNRAGTGSPSPPSQPFTAQSAVAFYDEWWFLVVVALSGLLLILLLIFVLIVRGQSQHKRQGSSGVVGKVPGLAQEEMVSLDERFTASLELSERRLPPKHSFGRSNTLPNRSPPRPSPGSLHYSDEDIPSKYSSLEKSETNGSISHKDKLSDIPEGPAVHVPEPEPDVPSETDSSHSFVNHYISEPSYFSSWRRQRRDIHACCGPVSERGEAEGANPGGKPPPYPAAEGFGPRSGMTAGLRPALRPAAMAGFSSFV